VAATGLHLIIGGLPLAALAASDPSIDLPDMLAHISATDTLLLLYVSLFGSAASYGVFFYLATVKGSLTRLSSLTFLTPMFAAAGGYFLLGETLTPIQLAGALVTLLGVTALNVSPGSDDAADGEAPKDGA
jgi:drug/metabolite transporter (DMT)-like permease